MEKYMPPFKRFHAITVALLHLVKLNQKTGLFVFDYLEKC